MKIYLVDSDVNNFQSLLLDDGERCRCGPMSFRCKPKLAAWEPPTVYSGSPLHEAGEFLDFCSSGAFAIAPRAMEKLHDIAAQAGELLQLPYEGQVFTVLNVLPAVDCLDRERSKFYRKDSFHDIVDYAFLSERVPRISIFKIPETLLDIYAVERTGDPKTEFKAAVKHHGLTGLIFKQIWEG